MKNKVEMGKQYKSSAPNGLFGGAAFRRVLAVDCAGDYPAAIELGDGRIINFTENGYFLDVKSDHQYNLIEVSPYADFKTDDKVMVSNDGIRWHPRHFDEEMYEVAWCFNEGGTSWTREGSCLWNYCRRPTEEELKESVR